MSFIGWVVIGLVAGALAQRIAGDEPRGCVYSVVVGVIGAVLGGALFQAAIGEGLTGFSWRSLGIALVGAVLLLVVLQAIGGRNRRRR